MIHKIYHMTRILSLHIVSKNLITKEKTNRKSRKIRKTGILGRNEYDSQTGDWQWVEKNPEKPLDNGD